MHGSAPAFLKCRADSRYTSYTRWQLAIGAVGHFYIVTRLPLDLPINSSGTDATNGNKLARTQESYSKSYILDKCNWAVLCIKHARI